MHNSPYALRKNILKIQPFESLKMKMLYSHRLGFEFPIVLPPGLRSNLPGCFRPSYHISIDFNEQIHRDLLFPCLYRTVNEVLHYFQVYENKKR